MPPSPITIFQFRFRWMHRVFNSPDYWFDTLNGRQPQIVLKNFPELRPLLKK